MTLDDEISKLLQTDAKIKNLAMKIPKFSRQSIAVCQDCRNNGIGSIPACTLENGLIVFCADNQVPWAPTRTLLIHELVHLYDMRVKNWDLDDQSYLTLSEARAYDYSEYCDSKNRPSRVTLETKPKCISRMVANSVSHIFKIDPDLLKAEVENIYKNREKIMSDLENF